jgi:hypothetical protein
MNEKKWVSLTKVQGDLQAELLRGLLEAQEIPVLLSREGAGRAYGINVGLLGEVEILVPDEFAQEAKIILTMYKDGSLENQSEDEN